MSLQVENVTKYYGKQAALKDASFTAAPGEVVGFLGPNGAGKSTMMKIITCYILPSSGKVKVAGFDIYEDSLEVRRRVGYLPENNPLYPEMYVREYLTFVAGLYGVKQKKKRVDEMIHMVGLGLEQKKRIGSLSKGYRQRVGLAQAMIHNPEVLILDEPTSGLDPNQLKDIRELIKELGKEKTVLLSTHIMQEVEAICDRAIIIRLGEIVADSPVKELQKFGEEESITVRLSAPIVPAKLKSIDGVLKVEKQANEVYRITISKGLAISAPLLELTQREGIVIEELSRDKARLEDVFKSLTQ